MSRLFELFVDHQGTKWRIDYYCDSLQALLDEGRLDDAKKSIELRESLLSLVELIETIERITDASND